MTEIEERLEKVEKEIDRIKNRNRKVEHDKAWETSWTRRVLVTVLTYFVIVIYFISADLPDPFVNSVVPAVAFILATATLPSIKKLWMSRFYNHSHPLEESPEETEYL